MGNSTKENYTHILKMQASLKNSRPGMKVPNLSCCVFFGKELERMHRQKKMPERWSYFVIDGKFSNDMG